MKTTVYQYDFIDAFSRMGRQDNFSYEGLEALYDYLIDYEESTGEEIELDVIALCCEYSEWEDIEEFLKNYGDNFQDHWESLTDDFAEDEEEARKEEMFEYIQDYTTIIDIDGTSFITQVF